MAVFQYTFTLLYLLLAVPLGLNAQKDSIRVKPADWPSTNKYIVQLRPNVRRKDWIQMIGAEIRDVVEWDIINGVAG